MEARFKFGDGWVSYELPEDAGVIGEVRDGYSVSLDGKYLDTFEDRDEAERALAAAMDEGKFWPDCFYVNERGNVDELIRTPAD